MLGKVLAGIGIAVLLIIMYATTIYTNIKICETINSIRNPYAEILKIFLILFWIFVWIITILCSVVTMWILIGYIIANGE